MGKYSARENRKPISQVDKSPHAVWRGIGCLMILIIPLMSIALAVQTLNYGFAHAWPIPYQWLGYPVMPDWVFKFALLNIITAPIRATRNLYAYSIVAAVYTIIIGGVISVVYAAVYRMMGPPRYGPFDAPPPNIKTKRYTR